MENENADLIVGARSFATAADLAVATSIAVLPTCRGIWRDRLTSCDHAFLGHRAYAQGGRLWQIRVVHCPSCESQIEFPISGYCTRSEAGTIWTSQRPKRSGSIVVIDDRIPEYDKDPDTWATFRSVRPLIDHDFKMTFLSGNGVARQPYTRTPQQMRVRVLSADFEFPKWLDETIGSSDWSWVTRPDVPNKHVNLRWSKAGTQITNRMRCVCLFWINLDRSRILVPQFRLSRLCHRVAAATGKNNFGTGKFILSGKRAWTM